jgi:hypothetical protein
MSETSGPTTETYRGFQAAFDVFNAELFGGGLPGCMITLRTFGKARGYFSPDRFVHLTEVTTTHEIALDPRQFVDRTALEVLSTLAHEMCHLQQREVGQPSRGGYHNRQWADYMDAIGLVASDTGRPGGKRTGQRMTHYIAPGGRFEGVATGLIDSGRFVLAWADIEGFLDTTTPVGSVGGNGARVSGPVPGRRSGGKRAKYTCPACGVNVWGRAGLAIVCRDTTHTPIQMTAAG